MCNLLKMWKSKYRNYIQNTGSIIPLARLREDKCLMRISKFSCSSRWNFTFGLDSKNETKKVKTDQSFERKLRIENTTQSN